jgi:hypothetical protein
MRPKMERKDADFVYSFCKTETVVAESENKATVLFLSCAPKASSAI